MNAYSVTSPVQAAVVTGLQSDPTRAMHVAQALRHYADFEVTVLGYAVRPALVTLLPVSGMAGVPITGIGTTAIMQCRQSAVQGHCEEIAKALIALPKDERPEIGYIEGSYHSISTTLSSTFDLVVVPHRFELPDVFGRWSPGLDTCLALSKPAPTLFCVSPSNWERIIVVQAGDRISWWAAQIVSVMSTRLDIPVQEWFPSKLDGMESKGSSIQERMPLPVYDSICGLDVATIPADQQPDICLALSANVVRSIFRFRKVRGVLRRWKGNCFIWP